MTTWVATFYGKYAHALIDHQAAHFKCGTRRTSYGPVTTFIPRCPRCEAKVLNLATYGDGKTPRDRSGAHNTHAKYLVPLTAEGLAVSPGEAGEMSNG